MRILLIQPYYKIFQNLKWFKPNTSIYQLYWKIRVNTSTSYTIQYLAGLIPEKYDIKLIDENKKRINFDHDADIICISCVTSTAPRGYTIADEFRKRGKTVVLGGYHPSCLPEEAKQHADSVVIGDAEDIFPGLLKDFENSKLKPFYHQKKSTTSEMLPKVRKDLENGIYFSETFETSRGCMYKCDFCSITHTKKGYIKRSVDDVIDQIKNIKRTISFSDPSIVMDVDYAKILFKKLSKLNKKFMCQGNANILSKYPELLKLSKYAGCIGWSIGLESISQKNIDEVSKSPNIVNEYKSLIKKIKDHGMISHGGIIFGFDNDKPDIFEKTLQILKDWEINDVGFHVLTPLPGTPLFEKLDKENRILTKDWSKYDLQHVVFQPKNMSPIQLEKGIKYAMKEFYSVSNLPHRLHSFPKRTFYQNLYMFKSVVSPAFFNSFRWV